MMQIGPRRIRMTALRDITARKQLESELRTARDQALEASRLKSEFLATMSHEIRTPMNAVIGMTSLLHETALTAKQEEMTRTILGGAESLLAIINDILDFSRIEAGRMRIDPVAFDFAQVLEETVALLAPRAREKKLELSCEIAPWSGALLSGDSGRVRQVLTNLIGNAIKFTDRGAIGVTVEPVQETASHSRLRVTVRDSGVGIASDVQSRIFEPFVQGDGSSTRRFGGTGLGLAITRQLIELMGGEIGFESAEGRGSVFWFELEFARCAPASATSPISAPPGKPIVAASNNETGRRIVGTGKIKKRRGLQLLLVEDNLANQRVATLLLEKMGCAVDLAENGQAGLERLAIKNYDAVLMDCQMPVLDGYETTRLIRSGGRPGLNPRVPIIAMTAYARPEDRARCLRTGMDDYVSKPIRESELDAALERCGVQPMTGAAAHSAPPVEEAVFDPVALATTRSLPGERGSLLAEMVNLYLSDEAERLERLARLAREKQAESLAEEVHNLGGNAASFGAIQVRRVALELEEAARGRDWTSVNLRMAELRQACARLKGKIEHADFLNR